MKFFDLSHQIYDGMPTYPSDPNISVKLVKNIREHNSLLHEFSMGTHTGTHLDVPSHIIKNGKSLEDFPINSFTGKAIKINIDECESLSDINDKFDGIILNTGWHKNYKDPNLFYGSNRPTIPDKLVEYSLSQKIKFFGCDLPSVDSSGNKNKPIHSSFLKSEVIIYESLANLDVLPSFKLINFYGFPLSILNLDGSPVRAVAII